MNQNTLHPNTQTLLSAWKRMTGKSATELPSPQSDEHPDLLAALFVIEKSDEGLWLFRNAGTEVHRRLGRDPVDHDFLDLWSGYDRLMTSSILKAVVEHGAPAILQARGEPLSGQHPRAEITLASLSNAEKSAPPNRLIGLYQALQTVSAEDEKPAWNHALEAIYPPQVEAPKRSHLRLVANNG